MDKPLLVMAPMAAELNFLKERALKKSPQVQVQQTGRLSLHFFPELNVAFAQGGHGKVEFAIHAMHVLQSEKYRGLCCAGGAGALDKTLKPLDIVVGESTIEHDRVLKFTKKMDPEFPGHPEWIQKIKSLGKADSIHFVRIASGDEDVTESGRAGAIRSKTQALCVAWEGAGGARACQFLKLPYIELRVITDLSDSSAIKDYKESLKAAMGGLGDLILGGLL